MAYYYVLTLVFILFFIYVSSEDEAVVTLMSKAERNKLREESRLMFYHAYNAYMDNAYPADELMPLTCKGRWRGVTPSRGDLDDVLGNFSLTLVDSLDTLAVMGDFSEFSHAVRLVLRDVSFDNDVVVSVFETNIRMLGGLLSAHVLAAALSSEVPALRWYKGELLALAEDLAGRLLPAFNTTTGIPHGRVNLRHGLQGLSESRETCTACAGTMILEMAALSRLTGNPIFEHKAHRAMDRLWKIRHHTSELMGTVINIHSGDWVRKDSGVGAGIDSYYEYCLKAYILLGDENYLVRFNRHYNAVMKYISRPPVMMAVHMHRPHLHTRNFMDSLLAFWPGLQVLLGDLRPAVETHEMLYQVMQRHTFIPEAFTSDLQVHWGQYPLRPEFLESTYFLHRATGDDHYLHVGKKVLRALQRYTRVPCGYAAVNDVRTRVHEDRMDSYVLAETFKYLYMLFGEDRDLPINLQDYVLTTEAHFLPLSLAADVSAIQSILNDNEDEDKRMKTCPGTLSLVASNLRRPLRQMLGSTSRPPARLLPYSEPHQVHALADMGISVITVPDGRVQLLYTTVTAKSNKDAEEGLSFMHEVSKWKNLSDKENVVVPVGVRFLDRMLPAGPAHFGKKITEDTCLKGTVALAKPFDGCSPLEDPQTVADKFVMIRRGQCTFAQKVWHAQAAGARLAIIVDNVISSSHDTATLFAMAGDFDSLYETINIPAVFLFSLEGLLLLGEFHKQPDLIITVGEFKALEKTKECSDSVLGNDSKPAELSINEDSFDNLKHILSQLVAQFKLTLSKIDKIQSCTNDDDNILRTDDQHVVTKKKFMNENRLVEVARSCSDTTECLPGTQTEDEELSEGQEKETRRKAGSF